MKFKELTSMTLNILLWLILILGIYWLLLKLSGHSPTVDQITIMMLGAMFISQLKIHKDLGEIKYRLKESDRRFFALAKDFKNQLKNI